MMPACSHTGTPSIELDGFRHFTSSTTSGSACLIRLLTRASVSPRQPASSFILASISWEGEASSFSSAEVVSLSFIAQCFMHGAHCDALPTTFLTQARLEYNCHIGDHHLTSF